MITVLKCSPIPIEPYAVYVVDRSPTRKYTRLYAYIFDYRIHQMSLPKVGDLEAHHDTLQTHRGMVVSRSFIQNIYYQLQTPITLFHS